MIFSCAFCTFHSCHVYLYLGVEINVFSLDTSREVTVYTGETLYLCNHKYNPRRCLFHKYISLLSLLLKVKCNKNDAFLLEPYIDNFLDKYFAISRF